MEELRTINECVYALDKLIKLQEEADKRLKSLNSRIYTITHDLLPDAMMMAGNLKSFTMSDGRTIKVEDYLNASVPNEEEEPDRHRKAMNWMLRNYPDLVKHEISLTFTKDEAEQVQKLKLLLEKNKYDFYKDKEAVHHSTLSATFRQRVRQGIRTPFDMFRVNMGTHAVVKKGK